MTGPAQPPTQEASGGIPPAILDLFRRVLDPEAPQPLKMTAARGALPLPQGMMLRVLVSLSADTDPDVAQAAATSLEDFRADPGRLSALLDHPATPPEVLEHFGKITDPEAAPILRSVVIHPNTPVAALIELAPQITGEVLESLLLNESRLSQNPDILVTLKANPQLSPRQKKRIEEISIHLVRPDPVPGPATTAAEPDPAQPSPGPESAAAGPEPPVVPEEGEERWDPADEVLPQDLAAAPAEEEYAEEEGGLAADRIARLNVAEKIQLALTADREERMILVRDRNKTVATTVLKSPKINEKDVAVIAAMRNVDVEVLRSIGRRRDWLKNYTVAHSLIENPKTPVGLAMGLVHRLNNRDLKFLARNRNISDTIRRTAKKVFDARVMPSQKIDFRGKK
jgi:hypothetical protein